MATPLSAAAVLAALRAEGVRVVEVGSWRTHNRNQKGAFDQLNGSIVHHTVTKGTANTVAICRDGYSSLPGPLCHGVIAKDGQVHMVGWGRANHAGGGDPAVLAQVAAESYGARPTAPTKGNANGTDGNRHFYGWECENLGDGKDPWPAAQYDAIIRTQAALCRAHGWSAKSVIGHLEWSSDKVDPRGFTMSDLRAAVAERLTHPASWNPGSTTPSEEDDMALSAADIDKVADEVEKRTYNAVWRKDIMTPPTGAETKENPTWAAESVLRDAANQGRALRATVTAQGVAITQLAAAIAAQDTAVDVDALITRIETAIETAVIDVNINTGA